LGDLDLRNKYDINIIGLRKHRGEHLNVSFSGDYIVDKDIVLVGITESDIFERYDYLNQLT
jgi:trk system potassium uptake protein TrkA